MNSDLDKSHSEKTDPLNIFNLYDLFIINWKILFSCIFIFVSIGSIIFIFLPNKYVTIAEVFAINTTANKYDTLEFAEDISNKDLLIRFHKEIYNSFIINNAATDSNIIKNYTDLEQIINNLNISIDNQSLIVNIIFNSTDAININESKKFVKKLIEFGNQSVLASVIDTYKNRQKQLAQEELVIINTHNSEIEETITRIESEVSLLEQTSKDLLKNKIYDLESNLQIASQLGIDESNFSPEIIYNKGTTVYNNPMSRDSIDDNLPKYNFDANDRNINMLLDTENENFPLYFMGEKFLEAELDLKRNKLTRGISPSSIIFLKNKMVQLKSQTNRSEFIDGLEEVRAEKNAVDIAINDLQTQNAETIYFDDKTMLKVESLKVSYKIFAPILVILGSIFAGILIIYRLRTN